MKKATIIGAGLAGLAAARELTKNGFQVTIVEKEQFIGGLAAGYQKNGFIFDRGPHYFFSTFAQKSGIEKICCRVPHFEDVFLDNRFYRFPFGLVFKPSFLASVISANLKAPFNKGKDLNFHDFIERVYGKTFARSFIGPLFEKWSGKKTRELSLDYSKRLLPPRLDYLFYSIVKKMRGYTEDYFQAKRYFVYPENGLKQLWQKLRKETTATFLTGHTLKKINFTEKRIGSLELQSSDNPGQLKKIESKIFISTIPLNRLADISNREELNPYRQLKYRPLRILFLFLRQERALKTQWHWFPEKNYCFYRVAENKGVRENLAPAGKTVLTVEIACDKNEELWQQPLDSLVNTVWKDLQKIYSLKHEMLFDYDQFSTEYGYPLLLSKNDLLRQTIDYQTKIDNLFLAGRNGRCRYFMMEDAWDDGLNCARQIIKNSS